MKGEKLDLLFHFPKSPKWHTITDSIPTLNNGLSRLLDYYLVDHHFQKKPQRKEWYEITEKGIEISKYLEGEEIFELPEFHPIGMTTKSVDYCSLRLLI